MRAWSLDEKIQDALKNGGVVDTGYGQVSVSQAFADKTKPVSTVPGIADVNYRYEDEVILIKIPVQTEERWLNLYQIRDGIENGSIDRAQVPLCPAEKGSKTMMQAMEVLTKQINANRAKAGCTPIAPL